MAYRGTVLGILLLAASGGAALAGAPGCATCYRPVVTPPVYGTVAEKVMLRAPRASAIEVPGQFETVAEKVLVSPARKVWQVTRDAHGRVVGCWVELPARYAVRHRTVMVRAPQIVPHVTPAVYGVQHRKVLLQPATAGWAPIGSF